MNLRILRFLAPFVLGLGSAPLFAEALPPITDTPVLKVSGEIAVVNVDDMAHFDMAMLRAMEGTSYTTTTIWTEGVSTFYGVPLATILDAVQASGSEIYAQAINDYAVTIPIDSVTERVPLVAFEMDGKPMPRRQKGPLWIVYPYDEGTEYKSDIIYTRSIWQLDRLEIVE